MRYKNIFTKKEDLDNFREACDISSEILTELKENIKIGVNAQEIDQLAGKLCKQNNVTPSFLGVPGPKQDFPANSCVLVNEEIVHAIPQDRIFQDGDIVKVDFGIKYKGFVTDHCITMGLGELTKEESQFVNIARLSIDTAIKQAVVGKKTGDVSNALQTVTEMAGFESVIGFGGHGIGRELHIGPSIPFYGKKGTGEELQEGMIICIENWMAMGDIKMTIDSDGWTLRTKDGSKSACFEEMVLVKKGKSEVLTRVK